MSPKLLFIAVGLFVGRFYYIGCDCSSVGDKIGRSDLKLQPTLSGADINCRKIERCLVEYRRKSFLHPYGGAASADISCQGQKLFHVDKFGFFVRDSLGRFLKIDLRVAWHHTDEIARAFASDHYGLEHSADIFSKTVGHVCGGEIILVYLIWHKAICYMRAVEQSRRVGLLYFFHQMQS